ncbi:uncharacterized protein LOC135107340 [Scylla paramamosain]|uniref:uncharacterized protein LOC135107340 n=1 Tax=Scylla paramamosain TaxID=85552 RepID=UPI0030835419
MRVTPVVVVVVVVVMGATYWPTGDALTCLQCDTKDNACRDANMTSVPCGGTCYWKMDLSRNFDVRRCHPFAMATKMLGMNNDMEDDCYCNYNDCNGINCYPSGPYNSSSCPSLAFLLSVLLLLLLRL